MTPNFVSNSHGRCLVTAVLIFLLVLFVAGCGQPAETVNPPIAFNPTATLPPTPTLAGVLALGLVGNVPTPPVTPRAGDAAAAGIAPPAGETAVSPLSPSVSATAGPTPLPAEHLALGDSAMQVQNYAAAVEHFTAVLAAGDLLGRTEQQRVRYNLALAHLQDGRYAAAITELNQLLTADGAPEPTTFLLGQAYEGQGDYGAAIAAYEAYLTANADMAAYISPLIAANHLALGDRAAALAAYETAVTASAHRLTTVANRLKLAEFYLADANYPAAIAQYDAVHDLAETEATKGQMTYLAGAAEIMAGNTEAGYQRYLRGVADYPGAYESYQGLIELVNVGVPVDDFQRGLVDLNAEAYEPAVNAFNTYIAANPATYRADTHLFLARAYAGVGNLAAALAELDKYAATDGAQAAIERAKMLDRAGDRATALAAYQAYLTEFPAGADAPLAAWETAVLLRSTGDITATIKAYETVAQAYPDSPDAPEALFEAGWLSYGQGDWATAVTHWQRAADNYPFSDFGNESLVWLMRVLPQLAAGGNVTSTAASPRVLPTPLPGEVPTVTPPAENSPPLTVAQSPAALLTQITERAANNTLPIYGAVRARDIARGLAPFAPAAKLTIPPTATGSQDEAEAWLRTYLGLEPGAVVRALAPELAYDRRLIMGEKLWNIGLQAAAKRELEALRLEVAENPLFSYQLALFFRDLGLYRSSILAATSILAEANISVFDAPQFIGQLSYPVYYADQILELAAAYGYDPLLQFSLVRQESLFESFARSGAAAQGLSQVIPDTGAYIAERLSWPNFTNDDLYKPYVGLAFGAYYLDMQLDTFDRHVHAALAAYNAGPGNAARWYELAGGDIDLFKETVDFTETRIYIERIYLGQAIYRYLYGE